MPRFSIVTPSLDQFCWLKCCAASIADQEGVTVEHIIQDAGTNCDLQEWASRFPRMRLYVEPDKGMFDGINRGLGRAAGEICGYLNCDEQYLPGTLATVDRYFKSHPEVDVVFGDAIVIDRNCEPVTYRRAVCPTPIHTWMSFPSILTCSTFFRRSIVERGLLFDDSWKAIGDVVWLLDLINAKVRMGVLGKPLAAFAVTGRNLSKGPVAEREVARLRSSNFVPPRWTRKPAIYWYWVKKLLAGGYFSRSVELGLYKPASPDRRQESREYRIGALMRQSYRTRWAMMPPLDD
jgi:glycosyltransferase involved in cell wall biosynthesis